MSHEERMSERQELLDKFGGGLLDVLKKRRQAREGKGKVEPTSDGTVEETPAPDRTGPFASYSFARLRTRSDKTVH